MSKKYQDKVNDILNADPYLLTKLKIVYELNCQLDMECEDDLIDEIYQAFIDNGNYYSVSAYITAIQNWCLEHETDFDLIEDYGKMLSEIY